MMRMRLRVSALGLALAAALGGCGEAPSEDVHPGKDIYQRHCFACHQAGIAGAPRFGDKETWAPRLAAGREAMIDNVKRGMAPGMPPRGACASCDDQELADAVDFMLLYVE
jgi:cytochrome c5